MYFFTIDSNNGWALFWSVLSVDLASSFLFLLRYWHIPRQANASDRSKQSLKQNDLVSIITIVTKYLFLRLSYDFTAQSKSRRISATKVRPNTEVKNICSYFYSFVYGAPSGSQLPVLMRKWANLRRFMQFLAFKRRILFFFWGIHNPWLGFGERRVQFKHFLFALEFIWIRLIRWIQLMLHK